MSDGHAEGCRPRQAGLPMSGRGRYHVSFGGSAGCSPLRLDVLTCVDARDAPHDERCGQPGCRGVFRAIDKHSETQP